MTKIDAAVSKLMKLDGGIVYTKRLSVRAEYERIMRWRYWSILNDHGNCDTLCANVS